MPRDILGEPIVTAAELDAMTPAERQVVFEARVVKDLGDLPADYVERLRSRAAALIAQRDPEQEESGVPHAS